MTMPPNTIDMSRWEQLEKRVQALEDVNAIRNLKAQYAAYCDDHYNPDGIAASSPPTRCGKARAWAGLRDGQRFVSFSVARRNLHLCHSL